MTRLAKGINPYSPAAGARRGTRALCGAQAYLHWLGAYFEESVPGAGTCIGGFNPVASVELAEAHAQSMLPTALAAVRS